MPPEQLPWDRRDFRKHERSGPDPRFGGGGFGGGGPHRWREHHHHPHAPPSHTSPYHHNNHQQQQRWYSDFRSSRPIPPGHGKQGGWHMYPDDAGHGFLPFGSRYNERNLEDDNFRPFANRGDARYFRNNRENRGSFSQKDWRSPSWEPSASPSGPGRPTNEVNNQKPVENTETCHEDNSKSNDSALLLPDSLPGQSPTLVKENNEKIGGVADGQVSLDQKSEKENDLGSIDWKPLKWSRSGSLSSRSSGFSHSGSSKSMGVDSEIMVDEQQKNATPVQSPAVVCVVPAAPAPSDETSSRKKPRLGWGEGLAKYEKKKVGPEDVAVVSSSDTETMQLPSVNLLDKSPRVASLSNCTSPATPSSVACSFSPGIDEKESIKATNIDHDVINLSRSPSNTPQNHYDGASFSLESLEISSIANLSSLINELLQSDDQSSAETGYVRTTSMNKLLLWKVNVSKALEVTESEIDSLETTLKSLVAEPPSSDPDPSPSCLLAQECHLKSCEEHVTGSGITIVPAPSQIVSSGAVISGNLPAALEDEHVALKDEEINSPGSATSKSIEVLPSIEHTFPSETPDCDEGFVCLEPNNSMDLEKSLENGCGNEDESGSSDDHKLIRRNCCGFTSVSDAHCDIDHIYDSILSSNKVTVNIAMEKLNKLLPAQQCLFDTSTASSVSSLPRDSSIIKEKFLIKKRSLKFKEKVVALKFKVFQHFWKEGRVVSIRKLRGKSHKKFDLGRTCKKNRSSGRSRFSYTAGTRTVPAEDVIEFVNRLLSESPFKPCRNTLKMPALILDKEVRMSRFISNNALVEDPCGVEKERSMINPWTSEERELFIDKLAIFGKDFTKIASFLEHKTVADCVEFYYKNHKSGSFARARKKPDLTKQSKSQSSTYLVATGKRWNREANAASLDILGEASAIAASVNEIENQHKCSSKIFIGTSSYLKIPRSGDIPLQRSNSLEMYSNETVAADVLAGICGSLSSEAMSSCITTSVDPIDGYQDRKNQRVSSCVKRPLTPDVTQNVDDECSDDSCEEMDSADWTDEEKSIFIQSVSSYGKDFLKISRRVGTRSREQCKIFFSKARKCLGLDQILPLDGNVVSGDVNGGGSDSEDACVVQTCPIICNDDSECKMQENGPPPDVGGERDLRPDSTICVNNRTPSSLDSAVEPLLKNLSTGDSMVNDNPAIDFNVDGKERDGATGGESKVGTLTVSSNSESVGAKEGDNCSHQSGLIEADKKAVAEVSVVHHGKDNEGGRAFLPEDNWESRKIEDKDANSTEVATGSSSVNVKKSESQVAVNISHHSVNARSSVQIESSQNTQADLPTCNTERSNVISLEQNGHFSSMESSTLFSVPIKYQRHSSGNDLTNGGANGIGEKNPDKIVRTIDRQQHVSGYSLSDPAEYSQILKGYPVSVQTLKEINGDINCKKYVPLQNVPEQDEKFHPDRCAEFSLQKCTRLNHQSEVVVSAPFPLQDQSTDHHRSRLGISSDADKPSRNGDVKLFGKILTSSQQKPDYPIQGEDEQHRRVDNQTLNLRFNQKVNLDTSLSKFDCTNYPGSENTPVRSFGFWDGNRANMGFPHLPDSALLLAKYPTAFSNNHSTTSSAKLDHSLNGVSIFSMASSNGVAAADYQVLRNREVQPHGVLFSEMQRRNGFDVGQGMQQQARGMINVVGRGGAGQCTGVSDPVAAIKMHYAKAQNVGMQGSNGVREDDAWTSNGDVGR